MDHHKRAVVGGHALVIRTALAGFLFIAPGALAYPPAELLDMDNPGFEANPVATNCFQGFTPSGWTLYDPNGIHDGAVDAVGGLNTQPGGPHFIDGAPEGDHVALIFLSEDIGDGPVGLTQVLGDVLELNTTYTLSVQVGNIASGQGPPPCDVFGFFDLDGFPGYQVQLLAGGVVIEQDNNTRGGLIPEGEFRRSIFHVTIGDEHPQAGAAIEVRLINLNMIDTPEDPGIEVDFDDVQLFRGCPILGDIDGSGETDLADVSLFVDVLLGLDEDLDHIREADLNCSNAADGEDIALFIQSVLN